jgi:hypothetical protein
MYTFISKPKLTVTVYYTRKHVSRVFEDLRKTKAPNTSLVMSPHILASVPSLPRFTLGKFFPLHGRLIIGDGRRLQSPPMKRMSG